MNTLYDSESFVVVHIQPNADLEALLPQMDTAPAPTLEQYAGLAQNPVVIH